MGRRGVFVVVGGLALAGCGGSNGADGGPPPVPSVSSLTPNRAAVGAGDTSLQVAGANFLSTSVVFWNTAPLATTFISSQALTAVIPASYLAFPSQAFVSVVTPGTSPSGALEFDVNDLDSYTEISQATKDLVWNPSAGVIYLSVPSTAAAYGNAVAVLDPDAGTVVTSQFTGSEPSRLALSDDGQFLYVGLDGAASVERLTLPSLGVSEMVSLGAHPVLGPYFALDLKVAPGLPHTAAVSLGTARADPDAQGGIVIFDDAIPRGTIAQGGSALYDSLAWGADATALYGSNDETTGADFYALSVDAGGVTLAHDYFNVLPANNGIHFLPSTGLVYGDDGMVLDPATGLPVGQFQASGLMVPDSQHGRAYFLTFTLGTPGVTLQVFDLTYMAPITSFVLPHVLGNPLRLIRWGARGLAFNTDSGLVYLLTGDFVDGST